jgi:membrane protease YdiL (CAAX protease family)
MNLIKDLLKDSGVISKLFLLIGTLCFFAIIGMFIWTLTVGGNTEDIFSLKLLQLTQSLSMFILPPFLLAYLWSQKPLTFLSLDKKTKGSNAIVVILIMVMLIPFINLLVDLNQQIILPKIFAGLEAQMKDMELKANELTQKMLNVSNLQGLAFNIFLIALLPALGEELFFRGTLQRILKDWKGATVAIWITAFIFSAIHLQFYGFIPRLLMGAFFGYMLVWSGNLWLPILAHFTNNVIAVIFYYLKNNGFQTINIDTVGTGNTLWLGCLSAVLGIAGIIWIQKRLEKQSTQ